MKQKILVAAEHWRQRTCIRFEPYDSQRHRGLDGIITIDDTGAGFVFFCFTI